MVEPSISPGGVHRFLTTWEWSQAGSQAGFADEETRPGEAPQPAKVNSKRGMELIAGWQDLRGLRWPS